MDLRRGDEAIEASGVARIRLRALLQELDKERTDPATDWGGLRQTHTPSGEILWLCPTHRAKMFPHR